MLLGEDWQPYGIEANREQNERYAELTLSAATALNPYIGYDRGSYGYDGKVVSVLVSRIAPRAHYGPIFGLLGIGPYASVDALIFHWPLSSTSS